mgnify:CR=1 FL=1|jgi:hypothetical protein
MQSARVVLAAAGTAMLLLAACSGDKAPQLMNVRQTTDGPDEFSILPPKPLEMPEDLAALPEPTLGGSNLTDPQPLDDAIVALGGSPNKSGTIPAADSALYAAAARKGASAGIRETLAAEDLEWRRDNDGRLLERLFDVNVYFKAYREMSLDQQAELARWRKVGAKTPSAPPPQAGE